MSRTSLGAIAAVAVLAAAILTLVAANKGPDAPSGGPGVLRDPPFSIRLDGALWQARTLRDREGAKDFALVAGDLPLEVQVSGRPGAGIAQVELRVDGKRQQLVPSRCSHGRCPVKTSVTFVPRLRASRLGDHRVDVLVRDPAGVSGAPAAGEHVTSFGFEVTSVKSVPTVETRTIAKLPPPPPRSAASAGLRRDALRVLAYSRGRGGLAAALGSSSVRIVEIGRLDGIPNRRGVTMLVSVVPPRYGIDTTVPSYVPSPGPGGATYSAQQVQMHVAVLRDALIDLDLSTGMVITFEPGPSSQTTGWSPSRAPAPAGAADED